MKRWVLFFLCLCLVGIPLFAQADYPVTQVANPCVFVCSTVVNDNGQMAFAGHDGVSFDIYFYDGVDILRLETPAIHDQYPRINARGQVVWEGYDGICWGIYFYNGTNIQQLTTSGCFGNYPDLNDSGVVVWSGSCDAYSSARDILIFDGETVGTIDVPNSINSTPKINNDGAVVWLSLDPEGWNIYLNTESGPVRISDPSFVNTMGQLNEQGDLAWCAYDGADWDMFFYDGATITRIENPGVLDRSTPCLNNNGDLVWQGRDGSDWEIFLSDGQVAIPLTDNSFNESNPQINDSGYVVWEGFDGTDWEVFLYNGSTVQQVTDNATDDASPQVNLEGTVTWNGTDAAGAAAIFFVEVGDTTPPVIKSVEGPDMLWPPNHKMVPVTLSVVVEDETDPEPVCRILEVTSSESETGCDPDDEGPDWAITGALTLNLRAERCGDGPGRVYTITVECEDASGNTSTEQIAVTVPHSRGKK